MRSKPKVSAIIPARGGSKGIPNKNLQRIGDRSLVGRAVGVCQRVPEVSEIFVSSDSEAILREANGYGARGLLRPPNLALDSSTSEEAISHWLEGLADRPEIVVFVECTSPFIRPESISAAIALVKDKQFDSVFSAAPTDVLLWEEDETGVFAPIAHNPSRQTLRQERKARFVETGAFFVFRAEDYLREKCRFFGRIGAVVVDPRHAIEIDEPWHLDLARLIEGANIWD